MAELHQVNRRKLIAGGFAFTVFSPLAMARNSDWATPIKLDGVPHLNVVKPNLFRSAQPTSEGFKALQDKLHVQAVLSLRESSNDLGLLAGTMIENKSVPMNAMTITEAQVIAALKILNAEMAKGPVLVHCLHGSDRTGAVIAMYRILYQRWSKEQAIDEMKNGGFGFHSIFFNIPIFIHNANIAKFKQALAIAP